MGWALGANLLFAADWIAIVGPQQNQDRNDSNQDSEASHHEASLAHVPRAVSSFVLACAKLRRNERSTRMNGPPPKWKLSKPTTTL